MAFELESDLLGTVDRGKKWLADFNAGKTKLILLDQSNNTDSIDVKWMGLFLKIILMLGSTFSSRLDWGSYIIFIAKTAS